MKSKYAVRNIEFCEDGIVISYLTIPDDLRATGLMLTRQLHIPTDGGEYVDELDEVLTAVNALLVDALEDFANLPPDDGYKAKPEPDDDDEDDDDEDDDEDEDEE